jgi:hypothetical protein
MPISQRGISRDHNPAVTFSWQNGIRVPKDWGNRRVWRKAEQQVVSCHDLHATVLHLLGMDHKRLTYYYNGRHEAHRRQGELIPRLPEAQASGLDPFQTIQTASGSSVAKHEHDRSLNFSCGE